MMQHKQRRPFTAEVQLANGQAQDGAGLSLDGPVAKGSIEGGAEIMAAIQALRREVGEIKQATVANAAEESYARDVRLEIAQMVKTIAKAKSEIASIKHPMAEDDRVSRASSELDATVLATEAATNTILGATEQIESKVREIFGHCADDEQITTLTDEIGAQLVLIMEACNFQDLTGQRITKVINTLRFIEDRILAMIAIWGPQAFEDLPGPVIVDPEDEARLTNGPATGNEGITQNEIDALFD